MSKLFVGGLSWHTDEATLKAEFEKYGELKEAVIVKDRDTGRSRGFAFVRYFNDQDALVAIGEMHDHEFDGRTIRVAYAADKRDRGRGDSPFPSAGGSMPGQGQSQMGQQLPQYPQQYQQQYPQGPSQYPVAPYMPPMYGRGYSQAPPQQPAYGMGSQQSYAPTGYGQVPMQHMPYQENGSGHDSQGVPANSQGASQGQLPIHQQTYQPQQGRNY